MTINSLTSSAITAIEREKRLTDGADDELGDDDHRQREILHDSPVPLCQRDRVQRFPEIVCHQRDIGRFERNVGPRRGHRNADGGFRKRGRCCLDCDSRTVRESKRQLSAYGHDRPLASVGHSP